jgi:ElaB/YqjD/DUF883 family membrane-anchored ribosome-binding protein
MAQETSAVTGNADAGTDDLHRQITALREDLQALRSDFGSMASAVGSHGRTRLSDAKDRLAESARHFETQVKEKAQAAYTTAHDTTAETAERARGEISKRPLTFVAGAFLGGLIIGRLLPRR